MSNLDNLDKNEIVSRVVDGLGAPRPGTRGSYSIDEMREQVSDAIDEAEKGLDIWRLGKEYDRTSEPGDHYTEQRRKKGEGRLNPVRRGPARRALGRSRRNVGDTDAVSHPNPTNEEIKKVAQYIGGGDDEKGTMDKIRSIMAEKEDYEPMDFHYEFYDHSKASKIVNKLMDAGEMSMNEWKRNILRVDDLLRGRKINQISSHKTHQTYLALNTFLEEAGIPEDDIDKMWDGIKQFLGETRMAPEEADDIIGIITDSVSDGMGDPDAIADLEKGLRKIIPGGNRRKKTKIDPVKRDKTRPKYLTPDRIDSFKKVMRGYGLGDAHINEFLDNAHEAGPETLAMQVADRMSPWDKFGTPEEKKWRQIHRDLLNAMPPTKDELPSSEKLHRMRLEEEKWRRDRENQRRDGAVDNTIKAWEEGIDDSDVPQAIRDFWDKEAANDKVKTLEPSTKPDDWDTLRRDRLSPPSTSRMQSDIARSIDMHPNLYDQLEPELQDGIDNIERLSGPALEELHFRIMDRAEDLQLSGFSYRDSPA